MITTDTITGWLREPDQFQGVVPQLLQKLTEDYPYFLPGHYLKHIALQQDGQHLYTLLEAFPANRVVLQQLLEPAKEQLEVLLDEPVAPETDLLEALGINPQPVLAIDYFSQQGIEVSSDLPEVEELAPHTEEEKSLLVVMSFEEWLSYINTKRLYKNFPAEATPDFISDHNLSLVTKYWIEKWSTMVSGTYSYASGKPYYNPANPVFLGDRTPDYHNLALQVSYLRSIGKWFTVFYLSVDNVMNRKNIFGYRYSADGQSRYPVQPAMFRTIFAGVNISLSKFDKDEL